MSEPTGDRAGATTRRVILAGVGAAGVVVALAACGDPKASGSGSTDGDQPDDTPTEDLIIHTGDIPVGGGKVYGDLDTVVTQPTAGDFKAFSATCTHEGCTVGSVRGGTINCPCHGSKYKITDGSVVHPAEGLTLQEQEPLPAKIVSIQGDVITVS